jgi:HlyD family secretion protein
MSRLAANIEVRRRGLSTRSVLAALSVLGVLLAAGFWLWPKFSHSSAESGPIMQTVERADFVHDIVDRGNVESTNNIEIRCEVRAKNAPGTTILEIVPEGTMVKKGDVLVKLDSSGLETERTAQKVIANAGEAALVQAKRAFDTATSTKDEYLHGQYEQLKKTTENEIYMATDELGKAEQFALFSKRLAAKGYITAQQLVADQFAVKKAQKTKEIAEIKLDVLEKYTKGKMLVQYESDIQTNKSKMESQTATCKLDQENLALIDKQIANCIIRAPSDGQVVYANVTGWMGNKEEVIAAGSMARERQVLIRLPDPNQMQVVARINEAKVAMIVKGMSATVRLDAFPDAELRGTVTRVDEFPIPSSFMGSSVKEYETVVRINEALPGLRPGLTAEVRIRAEQLANVIRAPVQSIFEHGDKFYGIVRKDDKLVAREVTLGSTNDKVVVIRDGLSDGDQVVLNSEKYRDKLDLPELPTESERALARATRRKNAPTAKVVKPDPAIGDESPKQDDDQLAEADRWFHHFDKNKDGKVREEDLPEGLRAAFQEADTNGDGVLDHDEWMAAAKREQQKNAEASKQGTKP